MERDVLRALVGLLCHEFGEPSLGTARLPDARVSWSSPTGDRAPGSCSRERLRLRIGDLSCALFSLDCSDDVFSRDLGLPPVVRLVTTEGVVLPALTMRNSSLWATGMEAEAGFDVEELIHLVTCVAAGAGACEATCVVDIILVEDTGGGVCPLGCACLLRTAGGGVPDISGTGGGGVSTRVPAAYFCRSLADALRTGTAEIRRPRVCVGVSCLTWLLAAGTVVVAFVGVSCLTAELVAVLVVVVVTETGSPCFLAIVRGCSMVLGTAADDPDAT